MDYVFESVTNNETKITVEEAQERFPLLSGAIKTDEEVAVFAAGITYSDYNSDNRCAIWQEVNLKTVKALQAGYRKMIGGKMVTSV